MRKRLAGLLIRTAHRIYPPRVTDYTVHNHGMSPEAAAAAVERVPRRQKLANQRGAGFGR